MLWKDIGSQKRVSKFTPKEFYEIDPRCPSQNFYGLNLVTLFCKLDPFITKQQILFVFIKWASLLFVFLLYFFHLFLIVMFVMKFFLLQVMLLSAFSAEWFLPNVIKLNVVLYVYCWMLFWRMSKAKGLFWIMLLCWMSSH